MEGHPYQTSESSELALAKDQGFQCEAPMNGEPKPHKRTFSEFSKLITMCEGCNW